MTFSYAHAESPDWNEAATACCARLLPLSPTANLGFLYVSDLLADSLAEIVDFFREETGVDEWVGGVGIGICATGIELYDRPAVVALVGTFPRDSFRVFASSAGGFGAFEKEHGEWLSSHRPYLGLVHGDPNQPETIGLIEDLAGRLETRFLVGGLASARGVTGIVAGGVTHGALSGVLFDESVGLITRLSQGCMPVGPSRYVTEGEDNIIAKLDNRAALEVFKQDVGQELAADLERAGGEVLVALPVSGSDTGDYVVRNLVGIDPENELLAIGDRVERGTRMFFCRRDPDSAREALLETLHSVRTSLRSAPKGGLYVSCLGRGINLFGPGSAELGLIKEVLGDLPLIGFYANGEIFGDRLYAYTGVLTVFT